MDVEPAQSRGALPEQRQSFLRLFWSKYESFRDGAYNLLDHSLQFSLMLTSLLIEFLLMACDLLLKVDDTIDQVISCKGLAALRWFVWRSCFKPFENPTTHQGRRQLVVF